MREMEIPRFPHTIEIRDLKNFIRTRLSQTIVMWPRQAIVLVGYMCWPNDPAARSEARAMLERWPHDMVPSVPPRLHRIQHEWLRVADIFSVYLDLVAGKHQARRGGPSIGKAVTLVAANARSRGTGAANLWRCWKAYKDVAHLVAAATVVCAEAKIRYREELFGLSEDEITLNENQFGLSEGQFLPFHMAMLMPDLVLSVALEFQRLGLSSRNTSGELALDTEPTSDAEQMSDLDARLNPETLWRIPLDMNALPIAPPIRKIRPQDLAILNARRAGNRGRANRNVTTPVLG